MAQHKDVSIDEIISEKDDFYSDNDIFNFNSWGADLSFRELIDRYDNDELIKPKMQRNYVWDKVEASRFIESLLLNLPIPSIFLAKTDDERLLIVDGYQRIKTVYDYVNGIFNVDNKIFKLTGSERINSNWRGKAFNELSDIEQRRIRNTTIHAIIFMQKGPSSTNTGMYQIFERINTSGRTLLPQEIRNCVYQNKQMNALLMDLNAASTWRMLYGSEKFDSRMRDMEFILRFFALKDLYENPPAFQTISLKKQLNLFMGCNENNTQDSIQNLSELFLLCIDKIFRALGEHAFHNISKSTSSGFSRKINPTIFDSIMIAVANSENPNEMERLGKNHLQLLNDSDYQELLKYRTTNVENILKRVDKVRSYMEL